jgi:hypothetical protein
LGTNASEVIQEAVLASSICGNPQARTGKGCDHVATSSMEAIIPDEAASCAAIRLGELNLDGPLTPRMEQRIFDIYPGYRPDWI